MTLKFKVPIIYVTWTVNCIFVISTECEEQFLCEPIFTSIDTSLNFLKKDVILN